MLLPEDRPKKNNKQISNCDQAPHCLEVPHLICTLFFRNILQSDVNRITITHLQKTPEKGLFKLGTD